MDKEFIGNIYMITSIDHKVLEYINKYDIIDDDNLCACKYVLAKENAKLLKINDNCYIDHDLLKNKKNYKIISMLLKNGGNSNLLMNYSVYNPYVGQLFVRDLKLQKSKKLEFKSNQ